MSAGTLSWLSIVRLGLVQMCLGSIVVLTTSTLNRLMVVELALAAAIPGALVALHYAIQMMRPKWGYTSDTGGKRTRWIIGGMAILATGALMAASAVVLMHTTFWPGMILSVLAYAVIGVGVGAAGTSLLALLASATAPERRAAAATITWLMMIAGIAVTASTVGIFLDPYSSTRLMQVVAIVTGGAVALTALAVAGIEKRAHTAHRAETDAAPFWEGLKEVWSEKRARVFTIFVFLSMVSYFMQELILEPYAGMVFGFTPGQSTGLSGAQHMGVFAGMITVGIASTGLGIGSLRTWVVAGCIGSAASLAAVAALGQVGQWLTPAVVAMGYFNGMFAVATIGAMMMLAGEGRKDREGTRVGLWGASQAIAAGFGGLTGAAAADLMRISLPVPEAFGTVFLAEAVLFIISAAMAFVILDRGRPVPAAGFVAGE
ncbi:BCD family MFS transporter [Phaeovulum vinaykumarii]|uniref:MFS transporter, BCD family, chlorophyll transporter n=1 Tax=Phaeovulum vinaykumarii TaxID=407234 RepID=A0A1N7L3X9_9RHOB|nr:BCD family MFS transporter [Phaeovulum vinaykumarii]SIS68538.1 MFS transporter, BCD family, chlorophyll transporter [Phaeovulum vinaykumarii]SOC00013.1 BCD family chlorophyll transporter-like MFS transporter [Phaeovulum vinaykumarii]